MSSHLKSSLFKIVRIALLLWITKLAINQMAHFFQDNLLMVLSRSIELNSFVFLSAQDIISVFIEISLSIIALVGIIKGKPYGWVAAISIPIFIFINNLIIILTNIGSLNMRIENYLISILYNIVFLAFATVGYRLFSTERKVKRNS